MTEWLFLLADLITTPFIAVFILSLAALTVFHHHKLWIVGLAFPLLSLIYISGQEQGVGAWLAHFSRHEEYHLLYNLALLLPGFALIAYYFEHSGVDARLSKYITSDAGLLVAVCLLSAVLDNIAAAMIGGVLVRARYGKANAPFALLVGVICASNLGGAPSPIGDTTTVMLFIAGKPVVALFASVVAVVAALAAVIVITTRHGVAPLTPRSGRPTPVKWSLFWPMLGIPGLLAGNIAFEQPGLGLWAGLLLGCLIGRTRLRLQELHPAGATMNGMIFLVLLVAAAGMIPTEAFRPLMARLSADSMAYALGVLSAFFDNIPLTKFALSLDGFDWGLLAYAVGFGGSATWFGSSAGVALGTHFPQLYQTRRWLVPFLQIQAAFLIGFAAYQLFYGPVLATTAALWAGVVGVIGAGPGWALVLTLVAGVTVAVLHLAGLPPAALPGVAARRLHAVRREWF